jgi:hypothetical protein
VASIIIVAIPMSEKTVRGGCSSILARSIHHGHWAIALIVWQAKG